MVWQTLIGEATDYVIVRPLPTFAEFNGGGPLETALGAEKAAALRAKLRDCEISVHRSIEAQFLTKGAGLISQLEQQILKRVPDLSF